MLCHCNIKGNKKRYSSKRTLITMAIGLAFVIAFQIWLHSPALLKRNTVNAAQKNGINKVEKIERSYVAVEAYNGTKKKGPEIMITADGEIFLNYNEISDIDSLALRLKDHLSHRTASDVATVNLRIHKKTNYGMVQKVLNALKSSGINDVCVTTGKKPSTRV